MYHINNVFLTALKYVGHDCQVQGNFASDIAVFTLDIVRCPALISSPVKQCKTDTTEIFILYRIIFNSSLLVVN